jgi:hypothetical protein
VFEGVQERLKQNQLKQKLYHDRGAQPLQPLEPGDSVRLHNGKTWQPALVTEKLVQPRSFLVEQNGRKYRRNRMVLMKTSEPAPPQIRPTLDIPSPRPVSPEPVPQRPVNPVPVLRTSRVSGRVIRPPSKLTDFVTT